MKYSSSFTNKEYAITIITSTLNCKDELIKTVKSLKNQTFDGFQWIIADGKSNDGTLDLIKDNSHVVTDWISARDTGIYDAWNKACVLIKGEWVLFLGAGDVLHADNTLECVVNKLANINEDFDIAYGNVIQEINGVLIYCYGEVDITQWEEYGPKLPAHQGVFHRSKVLNSERPFDDSYKVVADSKLLIKIFENQKPQYINLDVCKMLPGGVSSSDKTVVATMKEWLRLEKDVSYHLPVRKKIVYVFKSYLKYALNKMGVSENLKYILVGKL